MKVYAMTVYLLLLFSLIKTSSARMSPVGRRLRSQPGRPSPEASSSLHRRSRSLKASGVFPSLDMSVLHACGINQEGAAFCVGNNFGGQLGNGRTTGGASVSDDYEGLTGELFKVSGDFKFKSISSGVHDTCAIGRDDDRLYCWGEGAGSFIQPSPKDYIPDSKIDDYGDPYTSPVQVATDMKFKAVSLGYKYHLALTTSDTMVWWGWRDVAIDYDDYSDEQVLTLQSSPEEVQPGEKYSQISSSPGNFACAIRKSDKAAVCWGENKYGQLGDGTTSSRSAPTPVVGGKQYLRIETGRYSTCAIDIDYNLWCWGNREYGNMGDGNLSDENQLTPVKVVGQGKWLDVTVGEDTVCGIKETADNNLYCFGYGGYGSLGSGDTPESQAIPAPVSGGGIYVDVSCGYYSCCGIKTDSTGTASLWCWGVYEGFGSYYIDTKSPPINATPELVASGWGTNVSPKSLTSSDSSPNNTGAIVGGVIGGILAAAALAAGGFFLYKKQKAAQTSGEDQPTRPLPDYYASDLAYSNKLNATNTSSIAINPSPRALELTGSQPNSGSETSVLPLPNTNVGAGVKIIEKNELQLGACVGKGAFGKVYQATWNRTPVAVKVLGGENAVMELSTADLASLGQDMHKEAALMLQLQHPNCVQFFGICLAPPSIVTEFCARGSVMRLLQEARASPAKAAELTWQRRLGLLMDAARGMLHLHSHKPSAVLHRDVKSPNILITELWVAKVGDFNLSKMKEDYHSRSSSSAGLASNPRWISPEVLDGSAYTAAADVFSFAVVMWELLAWEMPWKSVSEFSIIKNVVSGKRLEIPSELPGPAAPSVQVLNSYKALMNRCWSQQPASRPGFDAIVDELEQLRSRC